MTKRKHNYPSKRADGGRRPNAGRPAKLTNGVRTSLFVEQSVLDTIAELFPAMPKADALRAVLDAGIEAL